MHLFKHNSVTINEYILKILYP